MVAIGRLSLLFLALASAAPATAAEAPTEQKIAYKFGRCLVEQDREAAVGLLGRLPLVHGEGKITESELGAASACFRPELAGVSAIALRGGITQELFLRDFEEFGLEPRRKGGFANLALPIDEGAADARTNALYKLGDCVVRNRTDSIDTLLRTPVGSRLERQVIERLAPIMSACHAAAPQTRVSRDDLRSILAQSAYAASTRYWSGRLQAVLR